MLILDLVALFLLFLTVTMDRNGGDLELLGAIQLDNNGTTDSLCVVFRHL